MIGRSALRVARQHGHSISTMLRFHAARADGAPESDVERIRATLNSDNTLRRTRPDVRAGKPPRVIARAFEMEFPPARGVATAGFATGFATERRPSAANVLNKSGKIGGERGIRMESASC
jgi:hypothetical protein